jgi:hypothetical protein
MSKEYAIIDLRGKVVQKCAVVPLTLNPGERLSVRDQYYKTFSIGPRISYLISGASGTAESISNADSSYVITVVGDNLDAVQRILYFFERLFDVSRDVTPPKLKRRNLRLPKLPSALARLRYLVVDYIIYGVVED